MKVRILLLALAVITLFQSVDVFAQDDAPDDPLRPTSTTKKIYLGPVVGYNRAMHSVKLNSFVEDPLCPYFENGSSNGYYVGMTYEQLFGATVGSKHSLIARVLYSTLPASFTKEGDTYPSLVGVDNNGDGKEDGYTTVQSSTKHSVEVAYNMVCAEIMYKFNAIGYLGLTAGPTFDFPIKKTIVQKYELVQPNNAQFKRVDPIPAGARYENNDRTYIAKDGDIPNSGSFRFGIKFGLQYEIITGSKYYIVPSIYYNLGLTNLSSDESWKVSALQAGIDIRFAL